MDLPGALYLPTDDGYVATELTIGPWDAGLQHAGPPECCRWVCADGRWVSLTLCHEPDMGKVLVRDGSGRAEAVDSYEDALRLARHWRSE